MIRLTRLNGKQITINALLIETIEETPDTMITLVTGKKIMVLEKVDDTVAMVQRFLQSVGLVGSMIKSLDSEGS
ncbi:MULTISPECIES: flagellar FlbD family protein [Paenibacillus]|uniref:Flagellar protein FlbD n=1 Tax=Paenibacillus naphthalenovorans TaxID=162209 RepID=A0A0U2U5D9_9BACL|nr:MULTISPECIES: flagellar FlbD family protein [Paenibacillus]ALS21641.1 flagellar protein FlbD [Paenibacillus naphthalenovorans]GCL71368.1 flagellar protein D [Paenibacillus naphthalenovorans]